MKFLERELQDLSELEKFNVLFFYFKINYPKKEIRNKVYKSESITQNATTTPSSSNVPVNIRKEKKNTIISIVPQVIVVN